VGEQSWHETFKTAAPVLHTDDYELRNRVMHEAYLPTKDEASPTAIRCWYLSLQAMQKLRWDLQNAVGVVSAAIIAEAKARLKLGEPTAAIYDGAILDDNESRSYRRLADDMTRLQRLDALFASLHDEQQPGTPGESR
jgi:hypothetical protein